MPYFYKNIFLYEYFFNMWFHNLTYVYSGMFIKVVLLYCQVIFPKVLLPVGFDGINLTELSTNVGFEIENLSISSQVL